jgi:heptosyltransferase-2
VPENKEKITVVLPNHLGDVVMSTPALRALRRGRPGAWIRVVLPRELMGVLRGLDLADEWVGHDLAAAPHAAARLWRRLRLARRLADSDLMVLLPNSLAAGLLARVSGARRRVGYARKGRGGLLTDAVEAPREGGRFKPIAMERYYLDLILRLGCADTGTHTELATEPAAERECDARFAAHGIAPDRPLVCLAPGAAFGPSKLWPMRSYGELARRLEQDGAQVALVHAPGEQAWADEIRRHAGPELIGLGGDGMDLSLLKSVISRARLLVCNDAGARHVAAAFDVPCLVLMGPTSVAYTNLNLKRTRLLREPVECSPCQRKVCPIDHRCMTRLTPQRVLREARAVLTQEGWRGGQDWPHDLEPEHAR